MCKVDSSNNYSFRAKSVGYNNNKNKRNSMNASYNRSVSISLLEGGGGKAFPMPSPVKTTTTKIEQQKPLSFDILSNVGLTLGSLALETAQQQEEKIEEECQLLRDARAITMDNSAFRKFKDSLLLHGNLSNASLKVHLRARVKENKRDMDHRNKNDYKKRPRRRNKNMVIIKEMTSEIDDDESPLELPKSCLDIAPPKAPILPLPDYFPSPRSVKQAKLDDDASQQEVESKTNELDALEAECMMLGPPGLGPGLDFERNFTL